MHLAIEIYRYIYIYRHQWKGNQGVSVLPSEIKGHRVILVCIFFSILLPTKPLTAETKELIK